MGSAHKCADCGKPIIAADDEAGVCARCGGRNRRVPSCKGCKHLVTWFEPSMESRCKALDPVYELEKFEAPDGKIVRRLVPVGGLLLRPYISRMREVDGECGREARLREPGLWERIRRWVTL